MATPPPPPDPDRFEEAVKAFRRRLPVTDKQFAKLSAAERRNAFTVANVAQARLVQEVWDAVGRAIEEGNTLDNFREEVENDLTKAWGAPDAMRVEMIFRTYVMRSYNEGRDEIFSHPEVRKARPYFRVDGVGDSRDCPTCEPLNGLVLPADDPFWRKTLFPLHPGCRCMKTALTPDEAQDEGIDDAPPDADEPADGFGKGEEFEPDMTAFSPEIRKVLKSKLG